MYAAFSHLVSSGLTADRTLRAVIDLPRGRQLTIDFRARTATLRGGDANRVPWSQLSFVCLPTYASREYELRIDLKKLGIAAGEKVRLNFSGSDELDSAVPIALNTTPQRQLHPSLTRDHNGQVRIANLNTLHQGLADDQRSESISRLLRAAQADIYCFQEESDEIPFRKAAPLLVPASDGQDVKLHWYGGCGIATPLPLEPIPMKLDRGAAALIELSNHKHVAVVSVHFKCCGCCQRALQVLRLRR